jgi:hypothetical protein
MRLRKFINEGRSKSITIEEAVEAIKNKCTDFIKNGSIVYRGVDDARDAALIVSPANFERKSRNTSNYYTLLMDNLPAWKSYPKRSKSIICATDIEYASNMGYAYRVYMFDGSKIGVCPTNDLWESFGLDVDSLEIFNDCIGMMINKFTDYDDSDIVTYNDLLQLFNKFDEHKSSFNIDRHTFPTFFDFKLFEPYFETDVKLIDFAKEILDPERHKFKLQNTRTFRNIKEREVWTDGTSILLRADITSDVIKSFSSSL